MISPVPRIAIPEPTSTDAAYNQRSLPQYIHAIKAAGGIAIPIGLLESPASQVRILASCSAILLPGSPADVDPTRYGQEAVPATAARDVAREAADDLLLRDAFAQEKPVLGICYRIAVPKRLAPGQPHPGLASRSGGRGCGARVHR